MLDACFARADSQIPRRRIDFKTSTEQDLPTLTQPYRKPVELASTFVKSAFDGRQMTKG